MTDSQGELFTKKMVIKYKEKQSLRSVAHRLGKIVRIIPDSPVKTILREIQILLVDIVTETREHPSVGSSRQTAANVRAIVEMRKEKMKYKAIAHIMGIDRATVARILKREGLTKTIKQG
jgi:hypothetical protein